MDTEYDPQADSAFVWLTAKPTGKKSVVHKELWPEELKGKIGLLFDVNKKLIGVEVLEASNYLPAELLTKK